MIQRTESAFESAAVQAGFVRGETTDEWSAPGLFLRRAGPWASLVSSAPRQADPLTEWLGRKGLWKPMSSAEGVVAAFDILCEPGHIGIAGRFDEDLPAESLVLAQINWGMATRESVPHLDWISPARNELDDIITTDALTMQIGLHLCLGRLLHEPDRLALRFPVVGPIAEDLSCTRRGWLRSILLEANSRWRLVRVGFTGANESDIAAEVDLTGAPPAILPDLARMGLDALRWVVGYTIETLSILTDANTACCVFEDFDHGDQCQKEK